MQKRISASRHPKYDCFLISSNGAPHTNDIPTESWVTFDNDLTSKLLDFLRTDGLLIADDSFTIPKTSQTMQLHRIRQAQGLPFKHSIINVHPLENIFSHEASFLHPILDEILKGGKTKNLSLLSALGEMSKTPHAHQPATRKPISEDIDLKILEEHLDLVSKSVLFRYEFDSENGRPFTVTEGKVLVQLATPQTFSANFTKACGPHIEKIYSHILSLTLLLLKNTTEEPSNADTFETFVNQRLSNAGELPLLEAALVITTLGKASTRAVLKTAALAGNVSALRNAAWDLSQFVLFQLLSRAANDAKTYLFATRDQGLADLALRCSLASLGGPTDNFEEWIGDFVVGLSWGASPKEKDKVMETLRRLATTKPIDRPQSLAEIQGDNLAMEGAIIAESSQHQK